MTGKPWPPPEIRKQWDEEDRALRGAVMADQREAAAAELARRGLNPADYGTTLLVLPQSLLKTLAAGCCRESSVAIAQAGVCRFLAADATPAPPAVILLPE